MPGVLQIVKIHASPERVYQALTTADGIRNWWTRDADLDTAVGGLGEFRFQGGKVHANVRIDALDAPTRVAWTALSGGGKFDEWAGTTILFELRAAGDYTILNLAHRGFAQVDEGFTLVTRGWGHYMQSLQKYLETGQGTPAPVNAGCQCPATPAQAIVAAVA